MDVARGCTYKNGKFRLRGKNYIVEVTPYYAAEPEAGTEKHLLYAQTELKLYKPFVETTDLYQGFESAQEALLNLQQTGYQRIHALAEGLNDVKFQDDFDQADPNSLPSDANGKIDMLFGMRENNAVLQERLE
jgi:hypothetical protein